MTLNRNILNKAVDGKFTEVSNTVKAVLHRKLSAHADSVEYSNSVDKIQQFRNKFAEINSEETKQ